MGEDARLGGKQRLDVLLVELGHFESREKAQRAIMAGHVLVDERVVDKSGTKVARDAAIRVKAADRYVGRGGHKLEAALDAFGVDPAGKICLDVGASTGGFTDCLLQRGAIKVFAIDVGHNQLHYRIRSDERVVAREGVNARFLDPADFEPRPEIAVADVSFISLTLVLPAISRILIPGGRAIVLVKPQFELERHLVGKGGIVRDAALHEQAVAKIRHWVEESGLFRWEGLIPSPLLGTDGNREFLASLARVVD